MKKWLSLALVLCVFPLFAEVQGRHHHHLSIYGEYLLLKRAKSTGVSLIEKEENGVTSEQSDRESLVDATDLVESMGYQSGCQVGLRAFPTIQETWEVRYFFPLHWKGIKKVSQSDDLTLPFGEGTIDYQGARSVAAIYYSSLQLADLNYWRHLTPRYTNFFSVSLVFGLRCFALDEKINLYFTKNAPLDFRIPPYSLLFRKEEETSRYQVKTKNWAFGPQLGGVIEYNPYSFLTWGFLLRLGACYNRGETERLWKDRGNRQLLFDQKESKSNCAYFTEGFPYVEVLVGKFFTLRIQYQFLYIGQVVLADKQVGERGKINNNGNVNYKGLNASLQFNF